MNSLQSVASHAGNIAAVFAGAAVVFVAMQTIVRGLGSSQSSSFADSNQKAETNDLSQKSAKRPNTKLLSQKKKSLNYEV